MLILLSPAKSQRQVSSYTSEPTPSPFLEETESIVRSMQKYSVDEIAVIMKSSQKIAAETAANFSAFFKSYNVSDCSSALLAYSGPAFKALDADSLTGVEIKRAEKQLIILSALYGVLHPQNIFLPYRLEMGLNFKPDNINSLTKFWRVRISSYLAELCIKEKHEFIVNLASAEYSKAVDFSQFKIPVITVEFKKKKGDNYRVVSSYAKTERGAMTRYILKNSVTALEDLKDYKENGYSFSASRSTSDLWCFTRENIQK